MSATPADQAGLEARLSPDVLFRELAGEAVLLDLKSQRYFGLDEVGTRVWQLLGEEVRLEAVRETMLAEFEVDEAQLTRELEVFVDELAEAGLIELERPESEDGAVR